MQEPRISRSSGLLGGLTLVAVSALGCGGTGARSQPSAGGTTDVDVMVAVDVGVRHQTLVGFGAAAAYYGSYLSDRTVANDDIYSVLFSDLGLDILRVANWYQTQSVTGATPATPFTDTAMVTVVQKATAALGHPPLIFMSSWSPPSYLKSTGKTKGDTRGTLLQDADGYAYDGFGEWWLGALRAYAGQGVVPDYISIQNEPDFFNADWETCLFDAREGARAGYGAALGAVHAALQGADLARVPRIIGPETSGIRGMSVQNYLAAMDTSQVDAIAHHLYNGGGAGSNPAPDSFAGAMTTIAAAAAVQQKPLFMTEYSPAMPAMFETAWLVHNALTVEGVSAYVYWELFWAPGDAVPNALVTVENPYMAFTTPRGYTINDLYYAIKHFARWTDPGYVRVDASSSAVPVKVSAFVSPDGASLTAVLLNTDTSDHVVALSPGSFAFNSAALYRTSGTSERAAPVPLGGGNAFALPARSIATVTLTQ